MTQFQDNLSPYISFAEHVDPSNPSAGNQRLFVDTDHILKMVDSSGTVTLFGTGLADPMTTRGDMIRRDSSNVTARLGRGSAGTILTSDGTDIAWGKGPLTTKGDLIATDGSALNRLAVGSDGQILTADAASTNGIKWAAAGGGGGTTIQYPALKPGTPTYDFAGAALDGAFSAYSTQGSFSTSHVITQGVHWNGSSVEMEYSLQMGGLYVSHGNGDLDFTVGGMGCYGEPGLSMMIGIAALSSSGGGIGVTAYSDTNCYFSSIASYAYTANSASWGGRGLVSGSSMGDYWFRLKRVSGTWTGYVSRSGRTWDNTFATRSDSVTVDKLVFGILFLGGTAYSSRVWADYMQVDV